MIADFYCVAEDCPNDLAFLPIPIEDLHYVYCEEVAYHKQCYIREFTKENPDVDQEGLKQFVEERNQEIVADGGRFLASIVEEELEDEDESIGYSVIPHPSAGSTATTPS